MKVSKEFEELDAEAKKLVVKLRETNTEAEAAVISVMALRMLLAGFDIPLESTVKDLLTLVSDNVVIERFRQRHGKVVGK